MTNLKLVITSNNEATGYNSEGKANSINVSCNYDIKANNNENIGNVSMSTSLGLYGNSSSEDYKEAMQALTDKIHTAFEQFKTAIAETI